jgi:hypothetical protein
MADPRLIPTEKWERSCFWLVAMAFLVKFILSFTTEFTIDEVYYTVWTYNWQWSYFDHPAAIGWLQRLTTFNGHWMTEFSCRLGPMLCSVIQATMVFRIAATLAGRNAGWLGVLAYSAMPYGSIISGWMVMPDVPLMTAWLLALAQMVKILEDPEKDQFDLGEGILLGVTLALALMSKVQSLFLGFGIGLMALYSHRHWWKRPGWYACVLIGLTGLIPQVWWNLNNGSPMTSYHSGRVGNSMHWDHLFGDFFAGWAYQNPLVMILLIAGTVLWMRRHPFGRSPFTRLFLFLSIPLLLTFMGVALFGDSLPHWTGPAYLTLLPMAAAGAMYSKKPTIILNWTRGGWWLFHLLVVFIVAFSKWYPFTIGTLKPPSKMGSGDLTLDFTGWNDWREPLHDALKKDLVIGKQPDSVWLFSGFHFPAAHIEFYYANPLGLRSKALGEFNSIHNFYYTNPNNGDLRTGDNAVWLDITNYDRHLPDAVKNSFESVGDAVWLPQVRNGSTVRYLRVIPLYHYRGGIPASGLIGR